MIFAPRRGLTQAGQQLRLAAGICIALVAAGSVSAQTAGNPVAGKVVAAKCMICHSVEPGVNKIGPSLAGVVGRKSGTLANFNYSPAMKASALTWDPATLDKYLTSPKAVVPGTKMIFPGLPSPVDRANVIAYLGSISTPAAGARPAAQK